MSSILRLRRFIRCDIMGREANIENLFGARKKIEYKPEEKQIQSFETYSENFNAFLDIEKKEEFSSQNPLDHLQKTEFRRMVEIFRDKREGEIAAILNKRALDLGSLRPTKNNIEDSV
jgi:hypothetical protein